MSSIVFSFLTRHRDILPSSNIRFLCSRSPRSSSCSNSFGFLDAEMILLVNDQYSAVSLKRYDWLPLGRYI